MKFIQLLRPINLAIIILTMCGVAVYLNNSILPVIFNQEKLHFILLVFSTVLIAAAGNIINDYFDVRADRINKPSRLIITRHIKRRWAIVSHWLLNGIAFCIALYLSIIYHSFSLVFIHLFSINLLWFYSLFFKRKFIVGNVVVALLTAMIPLLVVVFYQLQLGQQFKNVEKILFNTNYSFIYLLSFFAFVQNLAREIIKDMQDTEGDRLLQARTIPLVYGLRISYLAVIALLLVFPIMFGNYFITSLSEQSRFSISTLPFYLVAFVNIAIIILISISGIRTIKIQDHLLKLSMLIGLITLFT
jgi:4-hydroxybenzoate polyprenyltransferase